MEGIGALEQLCRLSDEEILNIGGTPMTYGKFKDQIVSRAKRVYLSDREYSVDFHPR